LIQFAECVWHLSGSDDEKNRWRNWEI
jgi:hypothetical protein